MRIKKKKWTRPYLEENQDKVVLTPVFTYEIDSRKTNILEIGTGKGSFIVNMAKRYPHFDFYGIEKNADVLALALRKVFELDESHNIFLMRADMGEAKETMKDEIFDYIFISHPDPWPKKKHGKRRLLHPNFLSAYFRILKPNGRLFFKTDDDALFEISLEYVKEFEKFGLISCERDYINRGEFDYQTEYETRFRSDGVKIKRLILQKEE